MITAQQFREAMAIVEAYCQQKNSVGIKKPHEIGCRVKLSEFGLVMQGNWNRKKRGKVVDFLKGAINHFSDATICVKWDGIKKPQYMHISQVEAIK